MADPLDTAHDPAAEAPRPLTAAERLAAAAVGVGCLVAVGLLLVVCGTAGPVRWGPALACTAALAVASRVRFEFEVGFTVPTQLAYVPLLFTLPPALTPVATLVALTAGRAVDVARGEAPLARLLLVPGNCWFTIGPAAVLALHPDGLMAGGPLWLLGVAVTAQFATDFAGSACREWLAHGIPLREQVEEAAWVYGVDAALTPVAALGAWALDEQPLAIFSFLPLLGLLSVFARERRSRMHQLEELSTAYRGTALVLGDVVEADDTYTGEHCKDVLELALQVATELHLGERHRRLVEFSALLHDVGKIAIPKSIINKAGPLDADEWQVMKTHTIEGQLLLDRVGGMMREVGAVVRASHEHWDGSGYPDGLAGEAIPIEARIVMACDAFNAMTTSRSYRRALPRHVAVGELRRCAGTQFDPTVVEALLRVIGRDDPELLQRRPHEVPNEAPDVREARAAAARGTAVA